MRWFVIGMVLLVAPLSVEAAQGRGKGAASAAPAQHDGVHGSVSVVFSTHDVEVIREHYATRYRSLPPGLQKKYARTGSLPPGWQKKMEPFPVSLERRLVALPSDYHRGVIDGHAVIYKGGVIVDATVLF